MKNDWKKLLLCLAVPLVTGGLATLFSGGMGDYQDLLQPPLSPPGWVFPVVWTILYLLMGYASYRVLMSGRPQEEIRQALTLYGIQLLLNFLWPILFFGFSWYLAAFFLLLALLAAIAATARLFSQIDKVAGNLLAPYILWVAFAGYLNLGVFLLN